MIHAQRYDYTDTAAIDLRNELNSAGSGEALNTYKLADDGDTTFTAVRDEVELTKTAVLWGNVDLQAGNNFIDIDSRAQLFGDLSASFGTLNVQFNLRGDISPGAIISTNRNYGATSEQNVTEKSVTTFTVDLETIAGTGSEEPEDPDLITQAGTYVLIDGDLTDGWVWRDVSLYYKGEIAHVQINGDEYTFSDGTRVSAIFVDIDGPYNLINRESIQLVVTAADGSSAVEVAEIATPVNNNGLVTVTWSEVPNAVAYTLQYATSEDFSDALQYTTNREAAENLNRAQLQLNSGEEYYFRVMAVTADGQRSDWKALPESFLVDTAADTTAPTAPSILTGMSQAGADGTGADLLNAGSCGEGVYLDWSDVTDASGVKAYVVEWKLASDADWSNAQSLEVTATEVVTTKTVGAVYESSRVVSSVVLDGSLLESGESYNWRVKAVDCNGNGAGDEGNWAYGDDFTYEESAAPNDPGNARFDLEGSVATLTWSAVQDDNGNPANNIRKYLIEYSQDSEFRSGVIRKEVTGNELIASGLTNYSFYYWRVKAVDNQGNQSNWVYGDSFLVYVKDESGPSAPSDLLATPDQLNVTLSWTPSSDGDPEAGDKYQSGLKGYILTYADNAAFENEIIISVTADEFGAEAPTSYTLENLSNDVEAYYWTLQAIDWAGNVSAVTTGDSFYVDTIPPEGLNNATLTVTGSTETGATLDFTWDVATDNRPGDVVYNLTFSDTADFSNVLGTYEGTTNSYSQSFSTEEVDLKTIYWKVTATDARENVTPALEGSTAVDLVDDTLPGAVTGVGA